MQIRRIVKESVVILASLTLLATEGSAKSPTWASWQNAQEPDVYKIEEYLETDGAGGEHEIVVIGAGRDQGILTGTIFKSYRFNGSVWTETGRMKALEVQDGRTVAIVESHASTLSRAFFPKFPGVMAGDVAVAQRLVVSRRQTVLPSATLSYFDIFEDPKATPTSFELKAEGYKQLREIAAAFAKARVSMLMVEGYTDHHGSSQANQVESYQRAMTVRQFLIDELGFDERRVVAIGYGEGEPADESMAPGYVEANRRIVLKAVPLTH